MCRNKDFNKFVDLLNCGIYDMILARDFAIVCEMPSKIITDDEHRLHSTDDYAISWNDGYKLRFIHGRSMPEKIFNGYVL